jgi:hypothetical protein
MQVAAPPPELSAKALKVLGASAEEVGGAVSPKALKVLGASAEEVLDRATAQPHKLAGHAPSTETYRLAASSSAPSLATRVPRLTITPGDGTAGAQVFVEATRRLRSVSSFPRRPPAAPAATDAEARVALPKLRSIASSPRPTPTTPTVAQLDVVLSKWSPSAGKSAAQMGAVGAQAELSGTELLRLARKSLKPSLLKVHESPIEDASLSI